ncbi:PI-PLC X domain-containing protein [Smittium mucronatum]|uniref:PI-PLC X domain-containing protein n=1 Tax=Smittium mucronatum TaxID=133383 RepID=A0A1R0H7S3_9FUNG|nr:PI-PLC X domain-containing protein [Smittium mucronatum]
MMTGVRPILFFLISCIGSLRITQGQESTMYCNGYKKLCDVPYNKVAFPTTHNSFAVAGGGLASNQHREIPEQLNDGMRAFMLDAHSKKVPLANLAKDLIKRNIIPLADIHLCHGNCEVLDAGKMVKTLMKFNRFLEKNPNEIVTILIENYHGFTSDEIYSNFLHCGLKKYMFNPSKYSNLNSDWPTLRQLIETNQRLVVFSSNKGGDPKIPQIMDESQYIAQTNYEVEHNSLQKSHPEFNCALNPPSPPKPLVVMNHFVQNRNTILGVKIQTSTTEGSSLVNTKKSILDHYKTCRLTQIFPNFIAIDFHDNQELFRAVASINRVTYENPYKLTFDDESRSPTNLSSIKKIPKLFTLLTVYLLGLIA